MKKCKRSAHFFQISIEGSSFFDKVEEKALHGNAFHLHGKFDRRAFFVVYKRIATISFVDWLNT